LAAILSQVIEVCVFRKTVAGPEYLLLQRSAAEKLFPNIWQLVTGTIKHNEAALQAALRELSEETGLAVKRFWTVPFVDSYFDLPSDAIQVVPVFAVEVDGVAVVHLSAEHQQFEWVSYSSAHERIVWPGQRFIVEIVHEYIIGRKEAARLLEVKQF
jgi:dATP pyrophosphohydrolase